MADNSKAFNSQLDSCDGWVNGEVITKGSITADRFDYDSFSLAIRELLEEFIDGGDGWLADLICELDCVGSGASVFEIRPTSFEFPPEGGTQSLEIIVGEKDKWNITQSN